MAIFGILSLLIPLGIVLAGLFAAFLAHRGHPTRATWTLLIASASNILIMILLGGSLFFLSTMSHSPSASGVFSNADFLEVCRVIVYLLWIASIVAYCCGVFQMGTQWKAHSEETAKLEQLAQELAINREQL